MRLLAVVVSAILGAGMLQREMPRVGADRIAHIHYNPVAGSGLDVTVYGTSLSHRAEWPEHIAGLPAPCGSGVISVTVHGVPGAGSRQGLQLIGAAPSIATDVVVLEYAINDADLFDGVSRKESRVNLQRIVTLLRKRNANMAIILMATNPVRGMQRLKRPDLAAYYHDYAAISDDLDVSFFDGTSRWAKTELTGDTLSDGLHPSPVFEASLYDRAMLAMLTRIFEHSCPGPNL